ncbi:MAG TPA: GtrA family protein [Acidimicrobiia bacterium]|nr:GtrA family protein [Acidimicrobiia bacterium]
MTRVRQWLRYGTVSIIATVTSMTLLAVLVTATAMPAGLANVIATAVGTVPSFELNRRWVWRKTGTRSLRGEVGPFWALSFAGLALSTLTVTLAAAWAAQMGVSGTMRTLVIELANVAVFGSLWIAQFLVLDRILFRSPGAPARSDTAHSVPAVPGPSLTDKVPS